MTVIDQQPPVQPVPDSAAHGTREVDTHLAHHFDTTKQQFEAAKLGMWLFLATELLLFGGLFCLYAVYRSNHPEIFEYGSQFLDTRWGAINTVVLILSSMSMAAAVTAAQLGRQRELIALLLATLIGGAIFMSIKYIEYHHKLHENLVWSVAFYERPDWVTTPDEEAAAAATSAEPVEPYVPDVAHGQALWTATCRSCHGVAGEGVAGQGKDIRGSSFVIARDDEAMLAFLMVGRSPNDPLNTTGVQMPPRGGNPLFKDEDLHDIVAFVRTLVGTEVVEVADGASDVESGAAADAPAEPFWIPKSSLPPAPPGPPGLDPHFGTVADDAAPTEYPHHSVDPDRPHNAHMFFALYFCMTGLHGVHVVVGMLVIGWLAWRAIRGHFGPEYFTPVDLGGLYWHVVDIIWIFLFPLLYLIG